MMRTRSAYKCGFRRTTFLAFTAIAAALLGPFAMDIVNAMAGGPQYETTSQNSTESKAAFESASVRLFDPKAGPVTPLSNLNPACGPAGRPRIDGRRFAITGSPYFLISIAYGKAE